MAITLKPVILKHQKRSDGTFNIKIRVTLNRKIGYIPTEHYVGAKQLTRDLKSIKDDFINEELTFEVIRLRKEISKLGAKINAFEIKEIVEYLSQKRLPQNSNDIDFIKFSKGVIDQMKKDGRSSCSNYQGAVNNLKSYLKKDTFNIYDFTARFLRKYEVHLRNKDNMGSRGLELNMSTLRSLFNQARAEYNDEDLGDIKIVHYPFNSYKIPKADVAEQRSLEIEQLIDIMNYKYKLSSRHATKTENPRPELARDMYMLSFYLIGMNAVDIYNLKKIDKNGRITYNRSKTKDRRADKAEISIKIPDEALPIILKYKDPARKRVFNFHQRYSTSDGFSIALNKGMKVIGKSIGVDKLDFYSARHTWATIARNDCDVSVDDIALALNHSTLSRVTDRYIRKDWSRIDNANEKVLSFLKTEKEESIKA